MDMELASYVARYGYDGDERLLTFDRVFFAESVEHAREQAEDAQEEGEVLISVWPAVEEDA